MIQSAEEFIRLRESSSKAEQSRATNDLASTEVWMEVIRKYPDFKIWVVHNKTTPIEILELLGGDEDADIRSAVAGKRVINTPIFNILANDPDELVRFALISNSQITLEKLTVIRIDDSDWLKEKLEERVVEINLEKEGKF